MSYNILKVCGTGKGENEFRPNAFRTDHIDILPMGLDDFFYNGKAKPGPLFILAPGKVCLIKTFPDFFLAVFGDSDSRVLDRDKYFLIPSRCLDIDGGVVVAELDGIVNQVVQDLSLIHI